MSNNLNFLGCAIVALRTRERLLLGVRELVALHVCAELRRVGTELADEPFGRGV